MTKSFVYTILMKAEMSIFLDQIKFFKTQGALDDNRLSSFLRAIK